MITIYSKFLRCPEGRAVLHSSLERWIQILGRLNRKQFGNSLPPLLRFFQKTCVCAGAMRRRWALPTIYTLRRKQQKFDKRFDLICKFLQERKNQSEKSF